MSDTVRISLFLLLSLPTVSGAVPDGAGHSTSASANALTFESAGRDPVNVQGRGRARLNGAQVASIPAAKPDPAASTLPGESPLEGADAACTEPVTSRVAPFEAPQDDLYSVGTAVVDITPEYPIRLNGFGNRREESAGIAQHIFARALAIGPPPGQGQSAAPLVLIALDSLGIRQPMVDEVAAQLKKSHNLPAANIAVTFTHSHCTPKVNGACDNIFSSAIPEDHQKHIDRYTNELTRHMIVAAQQALDGMQPAKLEWGVGEVKFAKNRRTVGGPLDHDLPTLVVRDPVTNNPRAIWVSYACHCVTLSFNQISGDWAGHAADLIERQNPGAVAYVSIGAGSDQNPVSGVTGDKIQVAEAQGMEIATEVQRLLKGNLRRITGRPQSVRRQISLPLNRTPTREELVEQTGKGRPTDRYNAQTQLARLDRGEKLLTRIDYVIQTWTFGESLCTTFLAGEVCVDYAHRLKRELDRERFWLHGYSNDFCCYIPSERLVKEGGYGGGAEVPYFALPATLQGGLEQKIVDEVRRQVPEAFHVPQGTQGVPPKSPEESLKCIQVVPGLRVQLAAAEPNVSDPVAIDFGPDGRLWVAEMNDYGHDVYESFQQSSRIRWLRDADADGFFETAETFVDGLRFPTDVKVWRDGVLICDAPDILLARDTDNDGRADSVTKLFSGFEVRNAQARVNSLRLGLDNWIYGAGGLFGGQITSTKTGEVVDCSNRDFRINPDTGAIQAVSGRTQQGRCRNDWGDWFGCSNGTLLRSIPADDPYARRNPLAVPTPIRTILTDAEAYKLYPPENLVRFELSGAPGRATSACGLGIYRDTRMGKEYLNDAFTCEPVHQSVHRIDFRRGGHVFTGSRGRDEASREFLSSTDRWFRPVQARTGPDGSLWVVDMYRYVIEHPRWIPQSSLAELNVYAGQGRGRIYRVLAATSQAGIAPPERARLIPDLTSLSDPDLVAEMDTLNGTKRDLIQQMLVWRNAENAAPDLRRILRTSESAAARLQVLSTLDGLGQLSAADIQQGLGDTNADVQRFSVSLGERTLDDVPEIRIAVIKLANSPEMRLRRQVALTLGESNSEDATRTLARMLTGSETDATVRSAALNAVTAENVGLILHTVAQSQTAGFGAATRMHLLKIAVATGDAATVRETLNRFLPAADTLTVKQNVDTWVAVLNELDRRAADPEFLSLVGDSTVVRAVFHSAMATLEVEGGGSERVTAALKLMGRDFGPYSRQVVSGPEDREKFSAAGRARRAARFLSPEYSSALQSAAVSAIASTRAKESAAMLLEAYPSLTADVRANVVAQLISEIRGQSALLSAIKSGVVRRDRLDATQRNAFLSNPNPAIRSAAEKIFGADPNSSRADIVQRHKASLQTKGSSERGRQVFRKRCSNCHRLEDHGHIVGPDLLALTNRDPLWLLTAILDPNRDVDERFLSWTAVTKNGRTASGMIAEMTDASVLLREAEGKEHQIQRSEIDVFRSSQKSLMPEGMERDLSVQDLNDIIAYLGGFATAPKSFPGNQPRVITPTERGLLKLTAATAEIRGTQIRFEEPFANIGWWHHDTDSVTWSVRLQEAGEFDVYINAACSREAAGNTFRIDGLSEPVSGTVVSTGGWDRYRQPKVGVAKLPAGDHVITVTGTAAAERALFDLKEVRLVPKGQAPMFAVADVTDSPLPRYPPDIAPFLLDESQSTERRQEVIDRRPGMGPAIVSLLVSDLPPGDVDEEYKRIPWIWRVAIAVARRNDGGEIRDLLEISVPQNGAPLRDWQAVVIGGGLINGLTQIGVWPDERLDEILEGLPHVRSVWPAVLKQSSGMADDENVRSGTRYDALRMVALRDQSKAIPHLLTYLTEDTSRELQMGAVSGLADIRSPQATDALTGALRFLQGRNRRLALEALLRTDARAAEFRKRVRDGRLKLTADESETLSQHPDADARRRFLSF